MVKGKAKKKRTLLIAPKMHKVPIINYKINSSHSTETNPSKDYFKDGAGRRENASTNVLYRRYKSKSSSLHADHANNQQ